MSRTRPMSSAPNDTPPSHKSHSVPPSLSGGSITSGLTARTPSRSNATATPIVRATSSVATSGYGRMQGPHATPRRAASTSPSTSTFSPAHSRTARQVIARSTVAAISASAYSAQGVRHVLAPRISATLAGVQFVSPDEVLPIPKSRDVNTRMARVEVVDMTTLNAVRWLEEKRSEKENTKEKGKTMRDLHELKPIGVLTSASPYKPAGEFLVGDVGQELSVARASTLSVALETVAARPFYDRNNGRNTASLDPPYHTHALVYAPRVTVFRDEHGGWTAPIDIDVVSCAAVQAGNAHAAAARSSNNGTLTHADVNERIARTLTLRLSRILSVFAMHRTSVLVLPAFGAGSFHNSTVLVASIFGKLLLKDGAPFKDVFERVVFSIPGRQGGVFEEALYGTLGGQSRMRKETGRTHSHTGATLKAAEAFDMSSLGSQLGDKAHSQTNNSIRNDKSGYGHTRSISSSTNIARRHVPPKAESNKFIVDDWRRNVAPSYKGTEVPDEGSNGSIWGRGTERGRDSRYGSGGHSQSGDRRSVLGQDSPSVRSAPNGDKWDDGELEYV